MSKQAVANKNIVGTTLMSLLLSISISIILLQILLYIFFITSKTYYKINTEINFIQDVEILKRHISNDFKRVKNITIFDTTDLFNFHKLPDKIKNKMLQGNISNGSSIVLIQKMLGNTLIAYYLEDNKIMRDEIINQSVAIIEQVTNFTMVAVNTDKYYLQINLSEAENIKFSFTRKIFATHANST